MKGTQWVAMVSAGLLVGAMAVAQTGSPQQSNPQNATTQSTSPQAGASGTVSTTGVSGSAGVATAPQNSTTTTQTAPQSSAPSSSQTSNPQAPQSTTTYTTTTQTTVPQSAQPATTSPQTGTTPGNPSSTQPATGVPGAVASTGQPEVLIDPAKIYNDKQPISWVGKPVTLQNVMVQDTNDTGNFWVGSDGHHRLLVVKQDSNANLKAMRFHKGDIVTISGTVQPASKYMAQATTESDGSMHDAEKSSGVFLLADNITVASSTHK